MQTSKRDLPLSRRLELCVDEVSAEDLVRAAAECRRTRRWAMLRIVLDELGQRLDECYRAIPSPSGSEECLPSVGVRNIGSEEL